MSLQSEIRNQKSEILPRSLLIIKPSSLGDIVQTLPAAALLREAYPNANITWVINPEWASLLRGNKCVDHVHIFPRGELGGFGLATRLLPWMRQTNRLKPDVALDFQGLLRSAFIGRTSHPRAFYGMSDAREGVRKFYDHIAPVDRNTHAVERYLALVENFGVPIQRPLRFPLPSGDPIQHFDDDVPFVLLHPFARGRRKSLSDLAVEDFCRALAPHRVVLAGRTKRGLPVADNTVNLLNHTSILQLVWLIRRARFTVSVDSGPMHIASALSDRLISIHSWSDPGKVGPYNESAWVWKNGELRQVRDLAPSTRRVKGRAFRRADVQQILPLVRQFL
ncbi:MAG: glycosyltransferase family 9 protein [Chthoniobacterales bacterium]|nr:glycosyltransferase family 9 protein [Chthoniobacterales bacterium]